MLIKYLIKTKAKGSILQYVLGIGLIFSTISILAITLAYYNQLIWIKNKTETKLALNVLSAIEYAKAVGISNIPFNQTQNIDLYSQNQDSIAITKSAWGLFDQLRFKAFKGKYSINEIYLTGSTPQTLYCIYLSNHLKLPLKLVGNTNITGDVYVPLNGIEAGYMNKQSFNGRYLVNGQINVSQQSLPSFSSDYYNKIDQVLSLLNTPQEETKLSDLPPNFYNSFENPTQTIFSTDRIYLEKSISGNIAILSTNEIIVLSGANLDNVLLVAPLITIKDGVNSRFQAFATKQIIIECNVKLAYPSVLFTTNQNNNAILIDDFSTITGAVVSSSLPNANTQNNSLITIKPNAKIIGEIVSEGFINMQGVISGRIITNGFLVDSGNNTYYNYLFDASLNANELPYNFILPDLFESSLQNPQLLMKCL